MIEVYPDAGLVELLLRLTDANVVYRLFANNVTPDRSTTLGSFTECSFSGYAAVTLTRSDFSLTGVVAHVGGIQALPVAFLNSSGTNQSAYGYYVTDSGNTILLKAARFDSAPVVKADTESYMVAAVWGDFSALF